MNTMNLYFDFEFTSLSPDAQPISLGVVSDEVNSFSKREGITDKTFPAREFYAEFTDFDINRCDEWVKENVVKKLLWERDMGLSGIPEVESPYETQAFGATNFIKKELLKWLKQFSIYQIQFVADCATWDWWFMMQLLAEWDEKPHKLSIDAQNIPNDMTAKEFIEQWENDVASLGMIDTLTHANYASVLTESTCKTGLPILPDNISPVVSDLNDMIAIKKKISPAEAFDLSREELALKYLARYSEKHKHNALWDAKMIKIIHDKLNE